MNQRQKEVQQQFLNSEKQVLKHLEMNYKVALDDINKKLEALMARQDADMQHVIYRIEHQKALKTQVQSILEQLQANEFDTLSEYLTNAYTDGFVGSMYDMHGQGVPLIIPIDQKQVVEAIQHDTKLSETLYTSLGKDTSKLNKQIAGEISRGIASGLGYTEISRNIANHAKVPKNNAMRIARTESHRIQCKASMDAQKKAKEKGADVVKQWDSTLDGDTRKSHRKLDGQTRELDEPFEVNGHKAMYPGDFGRAEEDINCRCAILQRARWALDEEELAVLKERAEFFELDNAKNFEEFEEKFLKASERVREDAQMMKKTPKTLEKTGKIRYNGNIPKNWKKVSVSEDDAVANANSKYNDARNCSKCAVAYEMRKRGYDVVATKTTHNHHLEHYPEDAWEDAKVISTSGSGLEDIISEMSNWEDGARVEISIVWNVRSSDGHIFVAEKNNGKIHFYDPQSGTSNAKKYFDRAMDGKTRYWRTDNLKPSDKGITACESR